MPVVDPDTPVVVVLEETLEEEGRLYDCGWVLGQSVSSAIFNSNMLEQDKQNKKLKKKQINITMFDANKAILAWDGIPG